MPFLMFLYRHGLWLSWPLLALGVFLLWTFISTAARLGERNRIGVLPLAAEQHLDFPEAGKVVLWLEGPQLTPRFKDLTFELHGSDGTVLKGSPVLLRNRSAGTTRVRISDRTFAIPHAGGYTLVTGGLGEARPGDENHNLVFMRPHQVQTVTAVLGIVLGAVLAIGALVNFFLRLSRGAGA